MKNILSYEHDLKKKTGGCSLLVLTASHSCLIQSIFKRKKNQ